VNKQFIGQYVSDVQLAARYGVNRSTIWRWASKGNLPAPTQLSPGCTRWRLDLIEQRDAERDAQAA
jgi:predicted DNA-binding transcriptional regulator AlpA